MRFRIGKNSKGYNPLGDNKYENAAGTEASPKGDKG